MTVLKCPRSQPVCHSSLPVTEDSKIAKWRLFPSDTIWITSISSSNSASGGNSRGPKFNGSMLTLARWTKSAGKAKLLPGAGSCGTSIPLKSLLDQADRSSGCRPPAAMGNVQLAWTSVALDSAGEAEPLPVQPTGTAQRLGQVQRTRLH